MRLAWAAALTAGLATPAAAAAAGAPTGPATGVPGGRVAIALHHVHGGQAGFAFLGHRVAVYGTVVPFVSGQRVVVTFSRDGRRVAAQSVQVLPTGRGTGRFSAGYSSRRDGMLRVSVRHAATAAQGAFAAHTASVRLIAPDLHVGSTGSAVYLLQRLLGRYNYSVPVSGRFDDATGRALIAYRKVLGRARVPTSDSGVFLSLATGQGAFHVLYPHDGKHIEANLTRQVLAEIDPGGHVRRIYMMSSGKPSTPTVVGRFRVYRKDLGVNAKGMVDSNYFISGYAIHGYADVPTYAASHGCLRIPIPDARSVFDWLSVGDPVDVYHEGGGGSHSVRGNAGP